MGNIIAYKCPSCGRPFETFKELGKYAAACSNGNCRRAYDYELFESEEKALQNLEKQAREMVQY